jgi:hypothetical protein
MPMIQIAGERDDYGASYLNSSFTLCVQALISVEISHSVSRHQVYFYYTVFSGCAYTFPRIMLIETKSICRLLFVRQASADVRKHSTTDLVFMPTQQYKNPSYTKAHNMDQQPQTVRSSPYTHPTKPLDYTVTSFQHRPPQEVCT